VAAPAPEQSAEAGEATVTAIGANAMMVPKIRPHCLDCMAVPSAVWRPAECVLPDKSAEPLWAERKSAEMSARRFGDFTICAFVATGSNTSRPDVNSP